MMPSGPLYQNQAKMSTLPGKLADDEAIPSRAHHHRPCSVTMASDAKQLHHTPTCSLYTRVSQRKGALRLPKAPAIREGV